MLKKFRQLLQRFWNNNHRLSEALVVKNHIVQIQDQDYFIAKAMMTDVPEIFQIERQVHNIAIWNERTLRRDLRQRQTRLYLVLRHHDKMVAFIGCYFDFKEHDCHISNLAVVPAYQNCGLGYFLLTALIQKSRKMDLKKVTLEVQQSNQKAIDLYHDLGFSDMETVKEYYNHHEDAIKMSLDITNIDTSPNNFGL